MTREWGGKFDEEGARAQAMCVGERVGGQNTVPKQAPAEEWRYIIIQLNCCLSGHCVPRRVSHCCKQIFAVLINRMVISKHLTRSVLWRGSCPIQCPQDCSVSEIVFIMH